MYRDLSNIQCRKVMCKKNVGKRNIFSYKRVFYYKINS
nr:MAG TPA: hypothetical protein [Caudoviricetes sp.]